MGGTFSFYIIFMSQRKRFLVILSLTCVVLVALFLLQESTSFQVLNTAPSLAELTLSSSSAATKGLFTGQACGEFGARRPLAVMLAGDPEARPLSGISLADAVIEMPVAPNFITRYMALFQCQEPSDIGSIRSARGPFIGLAKGYDAILAHWGGEHDALEALNAKVIDNLDALPNPFGAFYRKRGVPMPHDGFASYESLSFASASLGYRDGVEDARLLDFYSKSPSGLMEQRITIPYPGQFSVSYSYDPETHLYTRFKGGKEERDALTGKAVTTPNVLVVFAEVTPSYSQYVDVALDGNRGKLLFFHGGTMEEGFWEKNSFDAPLLFYDSSSRPLGLEAGGFWIQVAPSSFIIDVQ